MSSSYSSRDVIEALRLRYKQPEYTFLTEVPNATSYEKRRSCDAMAMGCWKTKGIHLHGFEIKVARSDWLKEIQDPDKSATFIERCHYWWLVCPAGIARLEELPANWGLMELGKRGGLKIRKAGTLNMQVTIDHNFLAAILRRSYTMNQDAEEVERIRDEAYQRGLNSATDNGSRKARELERELKNAQQAAELFEQVCGKPLSQYNAKEVAEVYRRFQSVIDAERVTAAAETRVCWIVQELQRVTGIVLKVQEEFGQKT